MTQKEFGLFILGMRGAYPKDNIPTEDRALEIWFNALQDIPYEAAEAFFQKWIQVNKWSPTIAEIRQGVVEMTTEGVPDWGQAWEEVQRAISRFGYPRPEEALASMSPATREAVKHIGFENICASEEPETTRAQFRSTYETTAKRYREDACLPDHVKQTLERIKQESLGKKQAEIEKRDYDFEALEQKVLSEPIGE